MENYGGKREKGERELSWRKRTLFTVILIVAPYLFFECIFSFLYVYGFVNPASGFFLEESGRTVHFDPIRGYLLTKTPSRFMRITEGTIEYIGTLVGNSQGFPDRDDFFPNRVANNKLRIAVFGDSFTAGQFIKKNWPDTVEDLSKYAGEPRLELLNFAVDGAGLANWWSVLIKIVKDERYDIDGIIFAVYPGDLFRGFTFAEHRGYKRHMLTRANSWVPESWPKNKTEARSLLKPLNGFIISTNQFDAIKNGTWFPGLPRPVRPYFFTKTCEMIDNVAGSAFQMRDVGSRHPSTQDLAIDGNFFSEDQEKLIKQISRFSNSNDLPVFVVRVPSRGGMIKKEDPSEDVLLFSKRLNAKFIDGAKAFEGLSDDKIRENFFPFDGHWNQEGSDRFANFMFHLLAEGE